MKQTVVGVFNSYDAAERAAGELAGQGFDRGEMRIQATESRSATTSGAGSTGTNDGDEGTGVMASIRHFFAELFGDEDDHAGNYTEAVRRGGAVLTVEADESRIEIARDVLSRAGAVDIDEQVSGWRSQGWSGQDATAGSGTTAGADMTTGSGTTAGSVAAASRTGASQSQAQVASGAENVLPVVQEELEVGKRQVRGGAVRVVSRVVSRPVSESVELRREEAVVERRPVEREASQADLAAFQERTVEVEEMAEKAVVNKTARVVEEVVVGKRVSSDTQVVEDTVRSTEVDVERVGGDATRRTSATEMAAGGDSGRTTGASDTAVSNEGEHRIGTTNVVTGDSGIAQPSAAGSMVGAVGGGAGGATAAGAGDAVGGSAGGTVGGTGSSGRRNFTDLEDEFRQDYQTNFANSGATYDEIQPAYRGGYELRGDSRYADSDWNDAEPELRQRWESEHPGSAWERVKAAVRRGWDRATS